MLHMIEILPLVPPFSEQGSTTMPGQPPMAQVHERDLVKDSTPTINFLDFFLCQISVHLSTVHHHKQLNWHN